MLCPVPEPAERTLAAALLLALALALGLGEAAAVRAEIHRLDPSGRAVPAPVFFAPEPADPLFGFLLGVLDEDLYGHVDAAELDSLMTLGGGSMMPVEVVNGMSRRPPGAGFETGLHSVVRITFEDEIDVPIPYSILGYNPGSLRASQEMVLLHWVVGDEDFVFSEEAEDESLGVDVRDGHLFVFAEGVMEMDIDGWLDRMLGGKLDDVRLSGFFVFRDGEERLGLGFGYNKKGNGRTGAFDFRRNESIFPASKAYLALGRTLRERGERYLRDLDTAAALHGTVPRSDATHR